MTPKKIYIAESSSKELCKKRYVWDCNASEELIDEGAWKINIPYILESEHKRIIDELKKHMGLLLASMDGQLDEYRLEYGESYPENPISVNAKQFLKSIQ